MDINKIISFRKCRWLLALLMMLPIGGKSQNTIIHELVIEMCDGVKHFFPIENDHPVMSGISVYDEKLEKIVQYLFIETDNVKTNYTRLKLDEITQIYTQEVPVVSVIANDLTMEYGDAVPTLTYRVEDGTITGEPKLNCSVTSKTSVGVYPISISSGSVTTRYAQFVAGKLTITKAPLTVKAKNYTIYQGDEFPTFDCDYDGFKNGDTQSRAIRPLPTVSTTATPDSPAGDYPLVVSGGKSKNYEFTYVDGTLTILASSGISDLMINDVPFDIYTSTGIIYEKSATSLNNLPKGIYILKLQNGKILKLTRK